MHQSTNSGTVDSLISTAADEEHKSQLAHQRGDHRVAHMHEANAKRFFSEALAADTRH